jgi:sugar/nucleoside kinase (ribokinase family)
VTTVSPCVVVAGKLVIDEVLHCASPVTPGSNQRAVERTLTGGGQAWHTTQAVVGSGAACTVTGWAGGDPDSRLLRGRLRSGGVRDLLVESGEAVRAIVLVGPDGDRAIVSHGGHGHLEPEALIAVDPLVDAAILHVDGYVLDGIGGDAVVALAHLAHGGGVPVTLEPPSVRRMDSAAPWLAALPPLTALLGRPAEVEAVRALLDHEPDIVVEHDADRPVRTTSRGVASMVPVPSARVQTTGAGDRFAGGWLAARAAGLGLEQAAEAGIRAAQRRAGSATG